MMSYKRFQSNIVFFLVGLGVIVLSLVDCDGEDEHIKLGPVVKGNVTKGCLLGKWESGDELSYVTYEFKNDLSIWIKEIKIKNESTFIPIEAYYIVKTWFVDNHMLYTRLIKKGWGSTLNDAILASKNYKPETKNKTRYSSTTYCDNNILSFWAYKVISNNVWAHDSIEELKLLGNEYILNDRNRTNLHFNSDHILIKVYKRKWIHNSRYKYSKSVSDMIWHKTEEGYLNKSCIQGDCDEVLYIKVDNNYYIREYTTLYTRIE
jgi:hypothetical protein